MSTLPSSSRKSRPMTPEPMQLLQGKTAVVTGGGSGIGREIGRVLARHGARVAVWDVSLAGATETCEQIKRAGGQAVAIEGTVTRSAEVERCVLETEAFSPSIDILVNNAGTSANRPTLELSDEEWSRCVSINLDGAFFCSRAIGRRMKNRGGCIVNIGSIFTTVAGPNRLAYCATKAGIGMMTKVLAVEWASCGIRVNCVGPGYIERQGRHRSIRPQAHTGGGLIHTPRRSFR